MKATTEREDEAEPVGMHLGGWLAYRLAQVASLIISVGGGYIWGSAGDERLGYVVAAILGLVNIILWQCIFAAAQNSARGHWGRFSLNLIGIIIAFPFVLKSDFRFFEYVKVTFFDKAATEETIDQAKVDTRNTTQGEVDAAKSFADATLVG